MPGCGDSPNLTEYTCLYPLDRFPKPHFSTSWRCQNLPIRLRGRYRSNISNATHLGNISNLLVVETLSVEMGLGVVFRVMKKCLHPPIHGHAPAAREQRTGGVTRSISTPRLACSACIPGGFRGKYRRPGNGRGHNGHSHGRFPCSERDSDRVGCHGNDRGNVHDQFFRSVTRP